MKYLIFNLRGILLSWRPEAVQMIIMQYFLRPPYNPGTTQNAKDADIINSLFEVPTKNQI